MRDFVYIFIDMLTDWPVGTILGIFLLLAIVFAAGFVIDQALGKSVVRSGVVIEKSHTPASTGTGVGPSIGGNGGVAVVVTSTPAKYTLFVDLDGGGTDDYETDLNTWLKTKVGDRVTYKVRVGRFSGV